jgi:hypothetical protein
MTPTDMTRGWQDYIAARIKRAQAAITGAVGDIMYAEEQKREAAERKFAAELEAVRETARRLELELAELRGRLLERDAAATSRQASIRSVS